MDSPDRAFDAQLTLEGDLRETCAPLQDGIPTGGSPEAKGVATEASLEVTLAQLFLTKLANAVRSRPRMFDWLLLSSYVPLQE